MELLIGAVLLALVAAFVLRPLLAERPGESGEDPEVADLEARKQAKYREIRDTQLDHAAGKLSEQDFRRQDAELRTEAVEILAQLDERRGRLPVGKPPPPGLTRAPTRASEDRADDEPPSSP